MQQTWQQKFTTAVIKMPLTICSPLPRQHCCCNSLVRRDIVLHAPLVCRAFKHGPFCSTASRLSKAYTGWKGQLGSHLEGGKRVERSPLVLAHPSAEVICDGRRRGCARASAQGLILLLVDPLLLQHACIPCLSSPFNGGNSTWKGSGQTLFSCTMHA